jgi:SAM-dependent methyltransferase
VNDDHHIYEQHEVWENWAQVDPLWAILSDPAKKGGRWDLEEFFASGRPDIDEVLGQIAALGVDLPRGRSLDFGCGVGRLSRALAVHFERVDGVDISETMVRLADEYNTFPDRVFYHVNVSPDLSLFGSDAFDLIFTTIVLQHNPADIVRKYIAEFIRVLRPNGVAAFDMTASVRVVTLPHGSHQAHIDVVAPAMLEPGESVRVPVTVTNTSSVDWPSGTRLALGNHWKKAEDREMLVQDDGRTPLSAGLSASSSRALDLQVTAPRTPGEYVLSVDVVEEGRCWFESVGSPVAEHRVRVRQSPLRSLSKRLSLAPRQTRSFEPRPFNMNGLPKDDVFETVAASGGSILGYEPSQRGGDHWDGYRYFVTKRD